MLSKTKSLALFPFKILLMVIHHNDRTELIHEINAISHHAIITVFTPRLWPARFQETRANLASRHDNRGIEAHELLYSAACNPVPPTMGIVPDAPVITVPAPKALASWTPMKPVPPWLAVTTTVGFEVQGTLATCRHCSWSLQRWESCQLFHACIH